MHHLFTRNVQADTRVSLYANVSGVLQGLRTSSEDTNKIFPNNIDNMYYYNFPMKFRLKQQMRLSFDKRI